MSTAQTGAITSLVQVGFNLPYNTCWGRESVLGVWMMVVGVSITGLGPPAEHWVPAAHAGGCRCCCCCAAVCLLPGRPAAARSAGAAGGACPQLESPPRSSALCPGRRCPSGSGAPGPGGAGKRCDHETDTFTEAGVVKCGGINAAKCPFSWDFENFNSLQDSKDQSSCPN